MKYLAHVPVEQYGFISVETDTEDEAVLAYQSIKNAFSAKHGLTDKAFAQVLLEYAQTGAIVDGGNYAFSEAQEVLMGEMRKLIRKNPPAELVQEVNSMAKTID